MRSITPVLNDGVEEMSSGLLYRNNNLNADAGMSAAHSCPMTEQPEVEHGAEVLELHPYLRPHAALPSPLELDPNQLCRGTRSFVSPVSNAEVEEAGDDKNYHEKKDARHVDGEIVQPPTISSSQNSSSSLQRRFSKQQHCSQNASRNPDTPLLLLLSSSSSSSEPLQHAASRIHRGAPSAVTAERHQNGDRGAWSEMGLPSDHGGSGVPIPKLPTSSTGITLPQRPSCFSPVSLFMPKLPSPMVQQRSHDAVGVTAERRLERAVQQPVASEELWLIDAALLEAAELMGSRE